MKCLKSKCFSSDNQLEAKIVQMHHCTWTHLLFFVNISIVIYYGPEPASMRSNRVSFIILEHLKQLGNIAFFCILQFLNSFELYTLFITNLHLFLFLRYKIKLIQHRRSTFKRKLFESVKSSIRKIGKQM